MEKLRSWNNESQPQFKWVLDSFQKTYQKAVNANFNDIFVVFVAYNLEKVKKTFGEFDRDVQHLRQRIFELRNEEKIVVLIGKNSYEFMVYAVSVVLNGMSLCPISSEDGVSRIAAKISQLGELALCFADKSLNDSERESLQAHPMISGSFEKNEKPLAAVPFDHDTPMILVFTSGSTGYSKIVEQMESNILSNVDALITRHKMQFDICIGTPLPLTHVNALEFSFFSTLLSGRKLVLFENFNLASLLQQVSEENIHVISLVPHMVRTFSDFAAKLEMSKLTSLRYAVSAASSLSRSVAESFVKTFPFRLIQGYGLSEAVNFSALTPIDLSITDYHRFLFSENKPSIGTAIDGNIIEILDEAGFIVEEGIEGELGIRGHNVMRGYRGDLQKLCFQNDFLMTGDLGYFRFTEGGEKYYFITGRKKETIKCFGHTISLLEVDELMQSMLSPEISGMTVPFDHNLAGEEIAFLISLNSFDLSVMEEVKLAAEKLPHTVRPKLIAWTNEQTKTISGKPIRWKFKKGFLPFQGILGKNAVLLVRDQIKS
jgi:acyl-CoA synthetase (AMP-forming)/AMP-acid ligase II